MCVCVCVCVCIYECMYVTGVGSGGGGGGAMECSPPTHTHTLLTPHFHFPLKLYVYITLTNNYLAFFIYQLIILWTISINWHRWLLVNNHTSKYNSFILVLYRRYINYVSVCTPPPPPPPTHTHTHFLAPSYATVCLCMYICVYVCRYRYPLLVDDVSQSCVTDSDSYISENTKVKLKVCVERIAGGWRDRCSNNLCVNSTPWKCCICV